MSRPDPRPSSYSLHLPPNPLSGEYQSFEGDNSLFASSDMSDQGGNSTTKLHEVDSEWHVEDGPQITEEYKLYRRRFIGLAQLTLVIGMIELDSSVYSNVTTHAAHYFNVSTHSINWLSIGFSLAFVPPLPIVLWILNKYGPKYGIVIASALVIVGNWIRYAGTVTKNFSVVVVGHIILAFANPFVLPAPTRYSRMWFSKNGRTTATGVSSLSSAAAGAIGGAIANPMLEALGMSNYVLVITIISTVLCLPAPFLPAQPPTPPSAEAAAPKLDLWRSLRILSRTRSYYLMFCSFVVFLAAFNGSSTIVSIAVEPYGFSQTNAALAGTFMVVAGLVSALTISPILDRTGSHLVAVKCMTPIIASGFLAMAFIPQTRSVAGLYVVFSLVGAATFAITPGSLEYQAALTFPASAEVSSIVCWTGGHIMTAAFVLIMQNLVNKHPMWGQPTGSVFRGLIFQAIMVWAVVPLTMLTGWGWFKRPALRHDTR